MMSLHTPIYFRDPFAPRESTFNRDPHWRPQQLDLNRVLTPPPDMSGVYHASYAGRGNYYQELGSQYNDYARAADSSNIAALLPAAESQSAYSSRTLSPAPPRKPSLIAPSFQIPRSVNASGGSLSELAAQITCLFWFESSDMLQQIEDSPVPIIPSRSLTKDAMPSTGFRKWVTTILSTTLVAQNVVLLALLFVHRLKKLNPTVKGKPGSEYRLLTVALMLGNKFLDDNTYTNKTWAEVSGINVGEVHIMEVEFLSNMKYCLYTSAEDWAKWQTLLGRYAAYFTQATQPRTNQSLAPILPPSSSLRLPAALPSPVSTHASPPSSFGTGIDQTYGNYPLKASMYTPATSVSTSIPDLPSSRKRSRDDYSAEPASKRMASGMHEFPCPTPSNQQQRLTLPSLTIPSVTGSNSHSALPTHNGHQLAPLNVPARAMAMVYPSSSMQPQAHAGATAGPTSLSAAAQMHSQYASRQHSPYPLSATGSPTVMYPQAQVSPSYFLQQRNSPYRPIRNVSTLLYPPSTSALQNQPQNFEINQMSYQPLSKSVQQRPQTGHLPYVHQNVWIDGNSQQAMTPIHQWPGFQGR